MNLAAHDCSPFTPQPKGAEVDWLRRLAAHVRVSDFVVPVSGDQRNEDEPVVYCDWDGTWWAGRYVGSISFEGSLLTIRPRLGLAALQNWLFEATSVALIESPGVLKEDSLFIVQLLAAVWAHGFVQATRHGFQPSDRETRITGASIKGRIDVRSSLRLIKEGQILRSALNALLIMQHPKQSLRRIASCGNGLAFPMSAGCRHGRTNFFLT